VDGERVKEVLSKVGKWIENVPGEIDGKSLPIFEKEYRKHHFYRFIETLELLDDEEVHENMKALEIGIAQGHLALLLKEILSVEIYGIDSRRPETPALEKIFQREKIAFKLCDLSKDKIPFSDETFDLVFLCEVLEHLPVHPLEILEEIRRVLRTRGILILTTPNFTAFHKRLHMLLGRNPQDFYFPKSHFRRHYREYTLDEVKQLLAKARFKITKKHMSSCWNKVYVTENFGNLISAVIMYLLPSTRECILIKSVKI